MMEIVRSRGYEGTLVDESSPVLLLGESHVLERCSQNNYPLTFQPVAGKVFSMKPILELE